jgi:hypothetical protein
MNAVCWGIRQCSVLGWQQISGEPDACIFTISLLYHAFRGSRCLSRHLSVKLHGITCQKIVISMRTSDLTQPLILFEVGFGFLTLLVVMACVACIFILDCSGFFKIPLRMLYKPILITLTLFAWTFFTLYRHTSILHVE